MDTTDWSADSCGGSCRCSEEAEEADMEVVSASDGMSGTGSGTTGGGSGGSEVGGVGEWLTGRSGGSCRLGDSGDSLHAVADCSEVSTVGAVVSESGVAGSEEWWVGL